MNAKQISRPCRHAGIRIFLLAGSLVFFIQPRTLAQIIRYSPPGDTTKVVTLQGYADVYFGFDFDQPKNGDRPYSVSYSKHNEVNLNLAYLSIQYSSPRARAKFTPGFGTYMNANYAAERVTLRNVVEANVGIKPLKNKNIWLDVGVFTAPHTPESAIAFDQLIYTRSFAAEYSPYYLTGGKVSLPLGRKTNLYLYLVNGWQVIEDQNSQLAFCSHLEIKPSDRVIIIWSMYAGNEQSISAPGDRGRLFSDLYCIYSPSDKLTFAIDVYAGRQKLADSIVKKEPFHWGQGNINGQYFINKGHAISARAEYFRDYHSILVIPVTGVNGFDCASFSLGYNWQITPNVQVRAEARYFASGRNVFYDEKLNPVSADALLIGGLVARF